MRKKSKIERFDPSVIPDLLEKAKGGDLQARDLLLYMFQRLVATLVHVCVTGKINPFSSYQKTFLRLFGKKNTPIQDIAAMLKINLTPYTKEEVFVFGQIAVLKAIEICEKNLASTICYTFKEEIANAIKEVVPTVHTEYDTLDQSVCMEDEIHLNIFMSTLSISNRIIVEKIIEGEKGVKIPASLKKELIAYLTPV